MTVVKVLARHYKGLSTDAKPVSVINGSTFRETDTRTMWISYDGTNWILADRRARITNENGSFVDLPGEFDDIETALASL